MPRIARTAGWLAAILLAACFLPLSGAENASGAAKAGATGPAPAQVATEIRAALFDAQRALPGDPAAAGERLAAARAAFAGEFAADIQAAAPKAGRRALDGFAAAENALAAAAHFAAARSQIWTAILAGGYAVAEQAAGRGDAATAQAWLLVREYRPPTRLSRPGIGATLAVQALAGATLAPAEAQLALRADLLDAYQARLNETLHDLPAAADRGFSVRRAELAGLAEGYFHILAPAYGREFGGERLQAALAAFAALRRAALAGQALAGPLEQVAAALQNFRAAPLTPAEQARRAGQLLRYLSLAPVEYARGVKTGADGAQVVHAFEVQEAISFHAAALAAFADLEDAIHGRDPAAAAQARAGLEALGRRLDQTARGAPAIPAAQIRSEAEALGALLAGTMPAEWLAGSQNSDFDVVASILDQMEAAVLANDYAAAEGARLEAYAIMEVGPEARLAAFAPQLSLEIEDLFWNGLAPDEGLAYQIKQRASRQEVSATRRRLDEKLAEAQAILTANTAPLTVAANAGMILFREGLEAVIILASLMSSMKRPEERRYRKPMWLGALGALAATILTWALAHDMLQSLAVYGEKLEALVSLAAIVVLLVIMNWFFHKVYWTDWIAAFHNRKRRILSGEAGLWLGLAALGFSSVYREGFETVLFLQALVLESGLGVVLSGAAAAMLAVGLVGFAAFRMQAHLPYKKMLIITGVLIGVTLLQMVGSTVHIFQVVGWLPIHAIGGQALPYWLGTWFGVYATWEGVLLQTAAAAFVIGSYVLAEGVKTNRRANQAGASGPASP